MFDWGLYDAKHTFDEIKNTGKVMELVPHQATSLRAEGFIVDPVGCGKPRLRETTVWLSPDRVEGKKIVAIKKLRGATGMGLKESKDMIDMMWDYKKPVPMPQWYCTDEIVGVLQAHGFVVKGFSAECFQGQEDLFTI